MSEEQAEAVDPRRSKNMAAIGQRGTRPEMVVRRVCHALGYRYRLNAKALPGTPDLVFGGRKKIIFVHGCFWHRHPNCARTTMPQTRTEFWETKFAKNVKRDKRQILELEELGWKVLVVWECEIKDQPSLRQRLLDFLEDPQ